MFVSPGRVWKSPIVRAFTVLSPMDQRRVVLVVFIQIFLGISDLLGVFMIGMLAGLSISGNQGNSTNFRFILDFLHLTDKTLQHQVLIVSIFAVLILVSRTLVSIVITKRILYFLSSRGAALSTELVSRLFTQPISKLQERSSQQIVYSATSGIEHVTMDILGGSVILISDFVLLVIMGIGLLYFDFYTAVATIMFFSFLGLSLYFLMHTKAQSLGYTTSRLHIESSVKILEVLKSYRESVVRNRRHFYSREVGALRFELADNLAGLTFMPYVSKYIIEASVLVGALLLGVVQFLMTDSVTAVTTLAIFLAAGSRIAPAVLRVQQGAVQIRKGIGMATPTLDLLETFSINTSIPRNSKQFPVEVLDFDYPGFNAEIYAEGVSLTYPGTLVPAVSNISITIQSGESVSFVGPSGAGKSTLIDTLLGVLPPSQGKIELSGIEPLRAAMQWPGAIAYVPQEILIKDGTIRENVGMGFSISSATDELVYEALKIASLDEFVAQLPLGIDARVGENGARLSGGQRQRLGIARAMFTKPKLLVLDEATSSLDEETEQAVSRALQSLHGKVTILMIAHRLSTIRNSDRVIYILDGKIEAQGKYEDVRSKVPNFDIEAIQFRE